MAPSLKGELISYRKRFSVEHAPSSAVLTVRALRVADVYIDGNLVTPVTSTLSQKKGAQIIDLSGLIRPGMHEVGIRVFNENGPAVLLASCEALNLFSGPSWEASYDESLWTPAVPAGKKKTLGLVAHFPGTYQALVSLLPFYVPISVVVFFLTLIAVSPRFGNSSFMRRFTPTPSGIRWLLLALWAILAINNILKVPVYIGMDVPEHYKYIEHVVNTGKVPLAPEGWQMFQPPLYYMLSAFIWRFPLSLWFDVPTGMLMLRIIPLLCGLLQVELAYRATKMAFPQRRELQIWGTIIGGLLPMNLYISQVVGNEPLSGLFSASAVVIGFHLLTSNREVIPNKNFILLGVVLGLALLTKVTAILLTPLAITAMIYALHQRQLSLRYTIARVALVSGIIFALAGWYYIRNWIELGRPFIGGWESFAWWQDPGYSTPSDFFSFGRALSAPIYAATHGFWDSLYSTMWLDGFVGAQGLYEYYPPWHYDFMLSGALLSLVPAGGILVGILVTIRRAFQREYRAQLFSVCCLGAYCAALFYHYLTVPFLSSAKSTYTLGLLPAYAILCATGLSFLSRHNLLTAVINACLACWAVAAYCSYFVL